MAAAGDVVDGRYLLEHLGARGGMANVWRAIDVATGEAVALKLHSRRHADAARVRHEATVLCSLEHPAVVRYLADGDPPGAPYLAMEWLDGEDLATRLLRGPLSIDEACALGVRLAEALGAVHAAGIVHCDLKPANVFLCAGRIEGAQLVDFGVSRTLGVEVDEQAWATGTMVGTPGYMAPEQFTAEHEVDARADLFALGALLFESLTGHAPFAGKHPMDTLRRTMQEAAPSLASLRADVPADLATLVTSLLEREPTRRPSAATDVAARLAACAPDIREMDQVS